MATRLAVSGLIKMLRLLWRERCIHQEKKRRKKSLNAVRNTEVPGSFVMVSHLFGYRVNPWSAKANSPRPASFFLHHLGSCFSCCSCIMTSDYSERCLTTCRRSCCVSSVKYAKETLGMLRSLKYLQLWCYLCLHIHFTLSMFCF